MNAFNPNVQANNRKAEEEKRRANMERRIAIANQMASMQMDAHSSNIERASYLALVSTIFFCIGLSYYVGYGIPFITLGLVAFIFSWVTAHDSKAKIQEIMNRVRENQMREKMESMGIRFEEEEETQDEEFVRPV